MPNDELMLQMLPSLTIERTVRKEVTSFGTFLTTLCRVFAITWISEISGSPIPPYTWVLRKNRVPSITSRVELGENLCSGTFTGRTMAHQLDPQQWQCLMLEQVGRWA